MSSSSVSSSFSNSSAQDFSLGILGSGQLGMMIAVAAKKLGYRVVVYDAVAEGPAVAVADHALVAPFEEGDALTSFINSVDVVTLEFENIPIAVLEAVAQERPMHPSPEVVCICQDRVKEKEFLQKHGFPVAPFYTVTSSSEVSDAMRKIEGDAILKTATLGYDGKGQVLLTSADEAVNAWASLNTLRAVLEKKISFVAEGSVIVARSQQGDVEVFPPQENKHSHGILDTSLVPARFLKETQASAVRMGIEIAEALGVVGLLTVEFFVLADGSLLVNELAPRPHNSGHHTLESAETTQFEQLVRAVTNLPLGSSTVSHAAVMVNLLGDLWVSGEPSWDQLNSLSNATLHLYGKKEARPGRKMGHFTLVGSDVENLLEKALLVQDALLPKKQQL